MIVVQWVLSGLLAFAFAFSAFCKLSSQQMQVDSFQQLGLPQWFRYLTGIIQIAGVILLVLGFWHAIYALTGGLLLGFVMVGATLFHMRVSDPVAKFAPAIMLSLLNFALSYFAYSNL